MKVVVVGATGNVGVRVVAELAVDPAVNQIIGIASRPATTHVDKVTWVVADIASDPLTELFNGADAVIHLAWLIQPVRDERRLRDVNVLGTRRVVDTAIKCGVSTVVCASSVGTYASDDSGIARGEDWPHTGIRTSIYSRHKAEVESYLDRVESETTSTRIVRLRTALVFQSRAASEISRFFLGPLAPTRLIGRRGLPIFPDISDVHVQVVHAADAARAYTAALHRNDARGAFNIAAQPVLTTSDLAAAFGARPIPVPKRAIRAAAKATFALRLQPTSPGWVDLGFGAPVMDTTAALTQLGWQPTHDSHFTVAELLKGFSQGAGTTTTPLAATSRTLPFPSSQGATL